LEVVMGGSPRVALTLLPGSRALLEAHERELPQRDDLCGAFCGALALAAAGIGAGAQEALDQDAVAHAAGSVVSAHPEEAHLPAGERSRRDYRLAPPLIEDALVSGTTPAGLVRALEELSGERLAAIPLSGPWSAASLERLFAAGVELERPVTLVANIATRHLWGSRPRPAQLLAYLLEGDDAGPAPDWDVGHFVCLIGQASGPAGTMYIVADTYPSLGRRGLHVQPAERLARALERPAMAPGGVVAVVLAPDAGRLREGAALAGLREGAWDNGSMSAPAPA
jgi:hypothetical protein